MEPIEITAQAVGIVAMAFNILSYQQKRQKGVIAFQLVGGALFAVNFLLLGAYVGGILNIIAAIRAVIFLNKEKLKADRPLWFMGFTAVYIAVYILSFTVFGTKAIPSSFVIELLPVIGMVATTVGFSLKKAADVRKCGLVSSPSWLIYNISNFSLGAIICETLSLISIVTGMIRLDINKPKKE